MSRRRRHQSDRFANDENAKSGGRPTDMEDIYVDVRSPGSFGGIRNLKRYSGHSEREVKTFLAGRDTYTLHKSRRIRFPRRKTYSKGIADLYQIDLADVSNLAAFNDGARYLLTCIDVFSKSAWAVPMHSY